MCVVNKEGERELWGAGGWLAKLFKAVCERKEQQQACNKYLKGKAKKEKRKRNAPRKATRKQTSNMKQVEISKERRRRKKEQKAQQAKINEVAKAKRNKHTHTRTGDDDGSITGKNMKRAMKAQTRKERGRGEAGRDGGLGKTEGRRCNTVVACWVRDDDNDDGDDV